MTQNSSYIPRNLATKSSWFMFAAGIAVGMLLIWALFTVNFGGINPQSSATGLNETAVSTPSYENENWEPYSHIGAPGAGTISDNELVYPVWEPYAERWAHINGK